MRGLHTDVLDIELIRRHSHGLADLVASAAPDAPVPTCGEWTMVDLGFHLYEVQRFWEHIIGKRPEGPETYDRPEPFTEGIAAELAAVSDRLVALLTDADVEEPAWSWSSDHTVGFTVRRQIHEALVHHIDGALAAGAAMPEVDPRLAADGVDELVDVMLTGLPDWATFVPAIQVVQLVASETGDRWTMSLGEVSGTSTETGVTYDGLPAAERVDDSMASDATIAGPALDLLLWMWGRAPLDRLDLTGDPATADALRHTITTATQ